MEPFQIIGTGMFDLFKVLFLWRIGSHNANMQGKSQEGQSIELIRTLQLMQGRHASELPSGFTTVSAGGNPDTTGVPGTVLLSPVMTRQTGNEWRSKSRGSTLQSAGKLWQTHWEACLHGILENSDWLRVSPWVGAIADIEPALLLCWKASGSCSNFPAFSTSQLKAGSVPQS